MKRRPAIEKSIKDITGEDYRVRVLATVVDRNPESLSILMDDGTGRAAVFFADADQFEMAVEGRLVRVFGKVKGEEKIEIEAELIQDMSDMDMGLYEQVKYITEKVRGGKDV